jgi:hypothetical protein
LRKLSTFWLLLLLTLIACEEEQPQMTCLVADPVQNLAWLNAKVQELEKSPYCQYVSRGSLRGNTVFLIGLCEPAISSIDAVYDCDGNLICYGSDDSCPDFYKEVKDLTPVWTNRKNP